MQNLTFERKKRKSEHLKKLKNKSVLRTSQNFTFRARETRDKRERDETETKQKPEPKQRKNTDKTKKEQRNAAYLFAGHQPPNETNKTPKKRAESEESET